MIENAWNDFRNHVLNGMTSMQCAELTTAFCTGYMAALNAMAEIDPSKRDWLLQQSRDVAIFCHSAVAEIMEAELKQ